MNTHTLRQHLHQYIDLNDEKLEELYLLIEDEMSHDPNFTLSDEEVAMLDKQREDHINGSGKSYTWKEVREIVIRNQQTRQGRREITSLRDLFRLR